VSSQHSEAVLEARHVLRGEAISAEVAKALVKRLKRELQFGLARRVLGRVRRTAGLNAQSSLGLWLGQQHALCTYKDPDLPRRKALDAAWIILEEVDRPQATEIKETLGIAGAIWKRRFELDNRKSHLELSLHYYRRGHKSRHADPDYGYTSINAAFVLDSLAQIEALSAPTEAAARLSEAAEIRAGVASALEEESARNGALRGEWWFLATIAEAYFGLGRYDEARQRLEEAAGLAGTPNWEKESTLRQLARLAWLRAQRAGDPAAAEHEWQGAANALLAVMPDCSDSALARRAAEDLLIGKVGLAMSGGGFRASLFHIGVLARLAELDALRLVEVLSCVSGGSIVGAYYYLKLRYLLEQKSDATIGRDDYIALVQETIQGFLNGVQRNLRTRVILSLKSNLRMFFLNDSRTLRLGELFQRELYGPIERRPGNSLVLGDLRIEPAGCDGSPRRFDPRHHNWERGHKVSNLILNATTLNTGHNWQFTASWMGEPPEGIGDGVDANERLRRAYFEPGGHPPIQLANAVAASACVPGLFEPIALSKHYPERSVELIDGGVYDNQGTAALLGENCDVLLVSDASGQMSTERRPKDGALQVALRANDILVKRVRTAQYRELEGRLENGQLRGMMFLHLKRDLFEDPVDWMLCQDPFDASDAARPPELRGPLTRYGILKSVQTQLAAIRTDLDSFSCTEAKALMLSGYRMAAYALGQGVGGLPRDTEQPVRWAFLDLGRLMSSAEEEPERHRRLLQLLQVGREQAFKIFLLVKPLRYAAQAAGGAVLVAFLYVSLLTDCSHAPLITVGSIGHAVVAGLVGVILGKTAALFWDRRSTLRKMALAAALAFFGTVTAWIHLRFFDPWFLKKGEDV